MVILVIQCNIVNREKRLARITDGATATCEVKKAILLCHSVNPLKSQIHLLFAKGYNTKALLYRSYHYSYSYYYYY